MKLVETLAGRKAFVFNAYDGEFQTYREVLLWWDEIDNEYVLSKLEHQVKSNVGEIRILNEDLKLKEDGVV